MSVRLLFLALFTASLAACGPFVDPNPQAEGIAPPLSGIRDTGIAANQMSRVDSQK